MSDAHQSPAATRSRQALVTRQRFAFAGALVVGGAAAVRAATAGAARPGLLRHQPGQPDRQFRRDRHRDLDPAVGRDLSGNAVGNADRAGDRGGARRRARAAADDAPALRPARHPDRLRRASGVGDRAPCRGPSPRPPPVRGGAVRDGRASRAIDGVDWKRMHRAALGETIDCDAVVADFSADLPRRMGSASSPTPRSPGGWSTRSSNCPNR